MRILVLAEQYPPAAGGVATSAQRIAQSLEALGAQVAVFTFDASRPLESLDYRLDETDGRVYVSRFGPFFLRHPNSGLLSEKQRAMLRRRSFNQMLLHCRATPPDVVLTLYLLNSGFIGQLLANTLQVPCVAGIRGNDIGLNIFHVERFGVIGWVVSSASRLVAVNQHLRNRLLTAFPEAQTKVSVIPNGVSDLLSSTPIDESHPRPWPHDDLVIGFVGTLREKKGVAWLLKSLSLKETDPRLKLLVIGPPLGNLERRLCGVEWDYLEKQGKVMTTGQVPRDEVPLWLRRCDAVIMPSLDDGMANGVLEAMVMGKCPIVTEVSLDAIGGDANGIVVPYGDSTALLAALKRIADDRELLSCLGGRARDFARAHRRPEQEALAYSRLFELVASEK